MCRKRLLVSRSFSCARVIFFFFLALNVMLPPPSVSLLTALAFALAAAEATADDCGVAWRLSSNRSRETARFPFDSSLPSRTCHCSGQSAPTNSSLMDKRQRVRSRTTRKWMQSSTKMENDPRDGLTYLWDIMTTPPLNSRIATARPPRESLSRKFVGSSRTRRCGFDHDAPASTTLTF